VASHQENIAKLPLKARTACLVQNDYTVRAFLTFLLARPPLLSQEGLPFPLRSPAHNTFVGLSGKQIHGQSLEWFSFKN
jgi:hypothetical protein